jgi:hypothetical protein
LHKSARGVKDQLRSKGEKVSHYAARDITAMAKEWLTEHRGELAEQYLAQARAMILSGALGKRARAQLVTEYRKERTVAQRSNFADQEQQLASCKLEALRTYPNGPDVILDAKIENYMATCMETHGYKFSFAPSACKVATTSFKREPLCYVPTSLIGRLIYRLGNWRLTPR